MRVIFGRQGSQGLLLIILLVFASCRAKNEESNIIPPVTSPLSRTCIGYGVINVSYTHIMNDPVDEEVSSGYLRRGSVVRIMERTAIIRENTSETWVLVEARPYGSPAASAGWLREELVDIYDNELQAETAAESMDQ